MHPILFKIGPLEVRTYGAIVAAAFFIVFFLIYKEAKRKNFYVEKIADLELLIFISGIIGARILHVLVNIDFYRQQPILESFLVWKGGLAFYGGLILGLLASSAYLLKNRMPILETADLVAPYLALGQSLGRIGCFLNGCCYGKAAALPFLGVVFPGEAILRYPTELYESLALLAIFIILRFVSERPHFSGLIMGLYLVFSGFQRFLIDFLRGDMPRYAGLTVSQLISIIIFVGAVIALAVIRWKRLESR